GVAVGLTAASDGAQTRHLGTRGVAVENLQDEQMHRRHRVENAVTPYMAHGRADAVNQFGAQKLGDIALDLLHGSEDTTGHPWPPVGMRKFVTPILPGGRFFLPDQLQGSFLLGLALKFMPFGPDTFSSSICPQPNLTLFLCPAKRQVPSSQARVRRADRNGSESRYPYNLPL